MNALKPQLNPRFWAALLLWAALLAGGLVGSAHADALDALRAKGELVVGVKKDVPLWGQWNEQKQQIEGLEPDLAADIARRLGLKLRLVGLQTAERVDAVLAGRVDVLIATLSTTPQRRQQLTLVEPHYYASGVNLLAYRRDGFKHWQDLRNRRVCGRRGAFYNRQVTVEYGADMIALYSNELAKQALRDGRCEAFLYDDTAILAMLQTSSWRREFEMPLPTLFTTPWAIALHPSERGGRLAQALAGIVAGWHRSGFLGQREAAWGIPRSPFVQQMSELWQRRKDAAGQGSDTWYCGEHPSAQTPAECLGTP
jgi:polar amino acid transport system substrate-binding protein